MNNRIGFVGLGVMGEPIAANMIKAGLGSMMVADLNPDPVARLVALGAERAADLAAIGAACDIIFMSLPGGDELEAVMLGAGGLLENGHEGQIIVDMSTAPVALSREIHARAAKKGIEFADAPVARTRQAAIDGNLSIMVGATRELFDKIRPYLGAAATDITLCGGIGAGQIVKLMNNMVLFQNVVALSEAMVTAERAGVARDVLLDAMSKGSADSFALNNHGRKAMLPGNFPTSAFGTDYAIKDITYALELVANAGVDAPSARLAKAMLERASKAGFGREYFPVLMKLVEDPEVRG